MSITRRILVFACAVGLAAACTSNNTSSEASSPSSGTTTVESSDPATADAVMKIVNDTMASAHLKSVIVRVTVDGKEIVTKAVGESMTGVPATVDMNFRNGAVAISYVSTLLLKLVDEMKKLSADFRRWFEQPDMDLYARGIGTILDPDGTRRNFAHEMLTVDEYRHLKMVVYFQQS